MTGVVTARNRIAKHVQANDTYYVDCGPMLETSETISSVAVSADDVTVGSEAVLGVNTTVVDDHGQSLTIEANTGVSFSMSGGTTGSADIVTVVITKNTGGIDAVDCPVDVSGVSA